MPTRPVIAASLGAAAFLAVGLWWCGTRLRPAPSDGASQHDLASASDFTLTPPPPVEPRAPADIVTLDELERRHVRHVLAAVGGSKTLAARKLGITRRTLYRKLERLADGAARADV